MFNVKTLTEKVTDATNAFISALTDAVKEARTNTTANRVAMMTAIYNYKQAVADENTVIDLVIDAGNKIAEVGYTMQDDTSRQYTIEDIADDVLDAIDDFNTGADLEDDEEEYVENESEPDEPSQVE